MPLFPSAVRHNNEFEPIIKAHENQIDGLGIFMGTTGTDNLSGDGYANGDTNVRYRNNLHESMRKEGYMAIMKDTNTALIFNGGSWFNTGNWSAINASNGLPTSGVTNSILVKNSSISYDTKWSNEITLSSVTIQNYGKVDDGISTLSFSRAKGSPFDKEGEVLGEIKSKALQASDKYVDASSIRFVAGAQATASGVQSTIEFFTSNKYGAAKAFVMGDDKTLLFSGSAAIPTAKAGAIYYNTSSDAFYLGGL